MSLAPLFDFMARGGPALWVIAALSVLTLALFLWRVIALAQAGAWRKPQAEAWIAEWIEGGSPPVTAARSPLDRVAMAAMRALLAPGFTPEAAEKETTRIAKAELAELRRGLRPLELIAAIAPLVGLLGTVLGMIGAFQALQESGSGADPSVLAGGIWEALLTTAAGMTVAIPASALASWIEGWLSVSRPQWKTPPPACSPRQPPARHCGTLRNDTGLRNTAREKRLSLAPMIDVVFLLLVFFMLASQFGRDRMVPLAMTGAGGTYQGPPRLVLVTAEGLRLNGVPMETEALAAQLGQLTRETSDAIILQPDASASLQHLMDAAGLLTGAGFTGLTVME